MSYVVFWLQQDEPTHQKFTDLQMTEALAFANRKRNEADVTHVVMSSQVDGQVGGRGVDAVEDGKLPDGTDYTWKKRRV